MIGYVMLGTNDLDKAVPFYEDLLSKAGASRAYAVDEMVAWRFGEDDTLLCVTKPYDKQAASVGNGVMVALKVQNAQAVDDLHARAIALGGTSEGDPGPRTEHFYAGYFRDPDGNKLNFYCYL